MFLKRKFIAAVFTIALAAILVLPLYRCNQKAVAAYHNFLSTEEFKKLSRTDQVAKCGTCHKQQYENELKGPHSHAYQMLKEHRDFVNSDKFNCGFYTKQVNGDFEGCTGCHTPQNLFETLLHDSIKTPAELAAELIKESHLRPETREGEALRATSTDCFSCHYDGKQMISLKHKASKEDSLPEHQTAEVIAKNNISCFPCHADVVKTINPAFAIKRTGSVLCVNCHQEYDASGKGTHYYFWNKDPKEKVNKKFVSLLNDFHFKIADDKKKGEISWINTTIPHPMSPGPEMVFKCEVLDKDSNLLGTKVIRTNKKKQFDAEMYTHLGSNNYYGEYGDDVTFDGSPLTYSVDVKSSSKAEFFKISLIHKAQYWFPDSLGVLTAVKVYPVSK